MSTGFNFILLGNSSGSLYANNTDSDSSLLSTDIDNSGSILTATSNYNQGDCMDAFGGKDMFGTIDLSNMDTNLFANADTSEAAGSLASAETIGSVAYGTAEAAGSVACSDGGGFDSGGGGGFSSMC